MIRGDHETSASEVHSMIGGSLTIAENAETVVSGMVNGNLVVRRGAKVTLTGMVNGDVRVVGGQFDGPGLIGGRIVQE